MNPRSPWVWALFLLVAVGARMPVRSQAAWRPPLGIPEPEFGIAERAPAPPANWTTGIPNFYYVAPSAPGATDADNPFGSPRRPRATVPTRLPAGAVVELRGVYDRSQDGPRRIVGLGTADQPVFLRGESPEHPAAIVQAWEVSGNYVVLEHLQFRARDRATTGSLVILAPAHHVVLRHSEVSGNLGGGGMGIESWNGRSTTSDIVVYDNKVHDNGDVRASFDQDRHGIHVGVRASRVWIVDNEMWRNSGDGLQINAGSSADEATTRFIYVGRNVSHHNKQAGFWTKQATDVIFSQNVAYAHRPSNSSLGAGMGFQYAPSYVWFLFNRVYDSDFGIGTGSDSGLGTGTESFFIGNLIHDIHDSDGDFNPGTGWQNCGISLPGGVNRYVVGNTIADVDSGVCSPDVSGRIELHDNIVFNVRPDGQHLFLEHPGLAERSHGTGNVFGPTYRRFTSGAQYEHREEARGAPGSNIVVADPGFLGTGPEPFDLRAGSAALDHAVEDPAAVYSLYLERYGLDIRRDILGRPRSSGAGTDSGAYERPAPAAR